MLRKALFLLVLQFAATGIAGAEDLVRLARREASLSPVPFSETVLSEALRRTEAQYGPWKIEHIKHSMARARLLDDIVDGDEINVAIAASQPDWEEQALTVWVPVDMGLSGLRIGFIRKEAQTVLAKARTLDDLRQFRLGVGLGWSSRKVMEASELQLQFAANQEALVRMLIAQRLDFFPRSISEAFAEHAEFSRLYPDLAIEKSLLLNMPLPTYIFVSPKQPKLAERINTGMEMLVRDGSLQKMVIRAHEDILAGAKLCERKIIQIPNPLLSERHPLKRPELWFDPYAAGGLCAVPAPASRQRKSK